MFSSLKTTWKLDFRKEKFGERIGGPRKSELFVGSSEKHELVHNFFNINDIEILNEYSDWFLRAVVFDRLSKLLVTDIRKYSQILNLKLGTAVFDGGTFKYDVKQGWIWKTEIVSEISKVNVRDLRHLFAHKIGVETDIYFKRLVEFPFETTFINILRDKLVRDLKISSSPSRPEQVIEKEVERENIPTEYEEKESLVPKNLFFDPENFRVIQEPWTVKRGSLTPTPIGLSIEYQVGPVGSMLHILYFHQKYWYNFVGYSNTNKQMTRDSPWLFRLIAYDQILHLFSSIHRERALEMRKKLEFDLQISSVSFKDGRKLEYEGSEWRLDGLPLRDSSPAKKEMIRDAIVPSGVDHGQYFWILYYIDFHADLAKSLRNAFFKGLRDKRSGIFVRKALAEVQMAWEERGNGMYGPIASHSHFCKIAMKKRHLTARENIFDLYIHNFQFVRREEVLSRRSAWLFRFIAFDRLTRFNLPSLPLLETTLEIGKIGLRGTEELVYSEQHGWEFRGRKISKYSEEERERLKKALAPEQFNADVYFWTLHYFKFETAKAQQIRDRLCEGFSGNET